MYFTTISAHLYQFCGVHGTSCRIILWRCSITLNISWIREPFICLRRTPSVLRASGMPNMEAEHAGAHALRLCRQVALPLTDATISSWQMHFVSTDVSGPPTSLYKTVRAALSTVGLGLSHERHQKPLSLGSCLACGNVVRCFWRRLIYESLREGCMDIALLMRRDEGQCQCEESL